MQQALNRNLWEDFPLSLPISPLPDCPRSEYMYSPSEGAGHSASQHDWGLHELGPKAIAETPEHHVGNFLDTAEHSLTRYSMQGNKSAQEVVSSWLWRQTIIILKDGYKISRVSQKDCRKTNKTRGKSWWMKFSYQQGTNVNVLVVTLTRDVNDKETSAGFKEFLSYFCWLFYNSKIILRIKFRNTFFINRAVV